MAYQNCTHVIGNGDLPGIIFTQSMRGTPLHCSDPVCMYTVDPLP
jgi:hypothetical protein